MRQQTQTQECATLTKRELTLRTDFLITESASSLALCSFICAWASAFACWDRTFIVASAVSADCLKCAASRWSLAIFEIQKKREGSAVISENREP